MSEDLLTRFEAGYPFGLDDFQREGCRRVAAGRGVLVAAPTGAGKTVVGEFGVFCALEQGRKCFYTTPIKALSNQKYHDLVRRYGAERVGLLTGDTSINSEAEVVVMTTEVLRNMIYAGSRTLHNLGYVVMDEVHYLADRFRGAVWEEVIIGLAPTVQLIALSATVSNAEEFGEWLDEVRGGVDIVVSERRPVPLYQHVLVGRDLVDLFEGVAPTAQALLPGERASADVDVNPRLLKIAKEESRAVRDDSRAPRGRSGRGKRDQRGRMGGGQAHGRFAERSRFFTSRSDMVRALKAARLLPAICFVFSRAGCDQAVRQVLGSSLDLTSNEERSEIQAILDAHTAGLSPDDLRALDFDWFAEGMRRGIAAHHAGMLPAFKECVEAAFVRGLIKIVFATETLALGINMPARSVVIEKLSKYNGETHADITPGEYTQLTGRAGRRGIDVEGHAIVLWQPGMDPRAVAGLASRRTYPLRSSFAPTYNMAVNLVSGVGRERARALLEQSFAQFQSDRSVVGTSRGIARNEEAIAAAWAAAECERGDFREYARMREEVSRLEAEAARARKADRRAESLDALSRLVPGDVVWVPAGRHEGWAVVINPGSGADREGPHPLVMTAAKQVKRLTMADFSTPVEPVTRVRVPKHFDARDSAARRSLGAALQARLGALDPTPPASAGRGRGPVDESALERIGELREALRRHPCHGCPDRETHARAAERALRLERENEGLEAKRRARTNTIATRFDKICLVLESLGYLTPGGDAVTEEGSRLARIYSELDLVAAEALRRGVFDGLNGPQLAAVLSSLVYESRVDGMRMHRMPDRASEAAQSELRRVWRDVGLTERDQRLPRARELDIGFAEAVYLWAAGHELAEVLHVSGLTAGDFVRWVRQVIDFCGQIADAAGPGWVRTQARSAVGAMRRGVIDLAPEEE